MAHSLSTKWSLYLYEKPLEDNENYADFIKKIGFFDNVEDFWRLFSHIKPVDTFDEKCAVHLFKNESRAMREDQEHVNGGSFLIRVSKQLSQYYWEKLVLSLIGNNMPDDVVGAIISSRGIYSLIFLWNRTSSDIELLKNICLEFAKATNLQPGTRIDYTYHNNSEGNTVHFLYNEQTITQFRIPTQKSQHTK